MMQRMHSSINDTSFRFNEAAQPDAQHASTSSYAQTTPPPAQTDERKRRGRKKGFHHSEATKAAMRRARLGVHPSKETIAKIAKGKLGYRHTEDARRKMGDTRRYNFIRKRIELAQSGKVTLPDLLNISYKTKQELESMSSFARNLYDTVSATIVQLFAHPHDVMLQQQTYAQLINHIKELYNDRIA